MMSDICDEFITKHEGKNTIWLQFENEISASSFVSQVYRRLDKISCSALRRDEHLSPNRRQKWLLAIRSDPHATPIKWILLMDSLTNMATMHDDSVSDSRESTSTNKSVALRSESESVKACKVKWRTWNHTTESEILWASWIRCLVLFSSQV